MHSYIRASSDKVGPVNLFLHSLFPSEEITLQSKAILANTIYPCISMIQPLLYYSQDVDNPQLFTTRFIKDDSDAPMRLIRLVTTWDCLDELHT